MKKNLFAFIAVLGLVGLFSACSSDDNNDPAPPVTSVKYDGVYKGDLDVSMSGLEIQVEDKIEIIKTGDNLATLQLKNFSFEGLRIGDIIVENVKVSSKNNVVKLTGKARMDLIVGDCAVTVDATVTDDNLTASIDVIATPPLNEDGSQSEDMEIKVTFKGVRTAVVASSEAEIISFGLKDIETTSVIEGEKVTLTVQKADAEKISKAIAVVTISDKATISPALDVEQDFSEPIEYTVTAEDGITKTIYTVTTEVNTPIGSVVTFDFTRANENEYTNNNSLNSSAIPLNQGSFTWGSSDGGVKMLISMSYATKFGVTYIAEDTDFGAPAFNIETQDTKGSGMVPKITSGSMFLGKFDLDFFDTLNSTKFGVKVDKKPLVASGTVSYKSGKDYYSASDMKIPGDTSELIPDKKDTGLISAVVYEVTDKDESLNGHNLYTSDKIIGIGKQVFKDSFKGDFEFKIEYSKEYDSTKNYKMALVLSASENGDKFSGAGGSVLKVSKLEVGFE